MVKEAEIAKIKNTNINISDIGVVYTERKLMPGEWAATGGSAVSGEDSLAAALRELNEEIGFEFNGSFSETVSALKSEFSISSCSSCLKSGNSSGRADLRATIATSI